MADMDDHIMQSLGWVIQETRESKKNKKHNPECRGCRVELIIHRHIMPTLGVMYDLDRQTKFTKLMESKLSPLFPTNLEFWVAPLVMSYLDHSETHNVVMDNIVKKRKTVESVCDEILQVYIPYKKILNWNGLIGGFKCSLINDGLIAHYDNIWPIDDRMSSMNMMTTDNEVHATRIADANAVLQLQTDNFR